MFAMRTGVSYQTIRDYGSVARAYEMSDRSDKLSFTHHREAMNAKKPEDRQKWLRRAEEGHWSVATLKSKLRQANAKEDSLDINVPNEEDTSTDEWYTPPDIIELAREVLDTIDLDPASCSKANETVKAIQFYDKNSDGLQHVWHGNVWLNPPYSKVSHFANKMVADIAA